MPISCPASSRNVGAAMARMKSEGVVFSTYKMLFDELIEAVEGERTVEKRFEGLGAFPDDLPDSAVQ